VDVKLSGGAPGALIPPPAPEDATDAFELPPPVFEIPPPIPEPSPPPAPLAERVAGLPPVSQPPEADEVFVSGPLFDDGTWGYRQPAARDWSPKAFCVGLCVILLVAGVLYWASKAGMEASTSVSTGPPPGFGMPAPPPPPPRVEPASTAGWAQTPGVGDDDTLVGVIESVQASPRFLTLKVGNPFAEMLGGASLAAEAAIVESVPGTLASITPGQWIRAQGQARRLTVDWLAFGDTTATVIGPLDGSVSRVAVQGKVVSTSPVIIESGAGLEFELAPRADGAFARLTAASPRDAIRPGADVFCHKAFGGSPEAFVADAVVCGVSERQCDLAAGWFAAGRVLSVQGISGPFTIQEFGSGGQASGRREIRLAGGVQAYRLTTAWPGDLASGVDVRAVGLPAAMDAQTVFAGAARVSSPGAKLVSYGPANGQSQATFELCGQVTSTKPLTVSYSDASALTATVALSPDASITIERAIGFDDLRPGDRVCCYGSRSIRITAGQMAGGPFGAGPAGSQASPGLGPGLGGTFTFEARQVVLQSRAAAEAPGR